MIPFSKDEIFHAATQIINDTFKSKIESDGGSFKLLKVEGSVVYIELGGACVGCPSIDMTLKNGIENSLKDKIDQSITVVNVPTNKKS